MITRNQKLCSKIDKALNRFAPFFWGWILLLWLLR